MSGPVGVDVGGTKLHAVRLGSDRAAVERSDRVPTPRGSDELIDALVGLARSLGVGPAGLGVGIAGLVGSGVVATSPNLPDVDHLDLATALRERLGVPVSVDNDATTAALAESRLGAARGADDFVVVTLGTGIGSAVAFDGEIRRGAHGYAGEFGHLVVDPAGPACPCGRRGCWERFASGSGLGRIARDAAQAGRLGDVVAALGGDAEAVRGEHVTRAAREGDREAQDVVDTFAGWIALGVANIVTALDVELVVLGGGVLEAADLLVERVRERALPMVQGASHRPPARIVAAELGEAAGAIGAALLSPA